MTSYPDAAAVAEIIRDVANTEILPRYQSLSDADIETKSSGEPVTIADEESERQLSARLAALLPGSLVIGEEAVERDPHLLDALQQDQPVWIIDPIDGTINFAAGRAPFVVIIALCHRGETVMGWIYEPLENRIAMTEKGSGAYIDGVEAKVSRAKPLADMEGYCAENLIPSGMKPAIGKLREACQSLTHPWCFGFEYLQLVAGQSDFSVIGRLYPWDHAAGVLLCEEAGGYVGMSDGRNYSPTINEGILMLAPDKMTWTRLRGILR